MLLQRKADVRGIPLQKYKRFHGAKIKTYDILNEDLFQGQQSMGLSDHFRVAGPICGLHRDQLVRKAGKMPLVIDVTVSDVVTPD